MNESSFMMCRGLPCFLFRGGLEIIPWVVKSLNDFKLDSSLSVAATTNRHGWNFSVYGTSTNQSFLKKYFNILRNSLICFSDENIYLAIPFGCLIQITVLLEHKSLYRVFLRKFPVFPLNYNSHVSAGEKQPPTAGLQTFCFVKCERDEKMCSD